MADSRKHILLVAVPGLGHIIPLLELGKKLKQNHNITFAVSECMLEKIVKRELVSKDAFPLYGIPDGFQETEFDPADVRGGASFFAMFSCTYSGVRQLLTEVPAADKKSPSHGITLPVDYVIGDNIFAEPLTLCHDRGIPYYYFNSASISMTVSALALNDDTPTIPDNQQNTFAFSEAPEPGSMEVPPVSAVLKDIMLPIHKTMHKVSGIFVNSVREIDQDFMELLQNFLVMKNIPLFFVGPLVPEDKISDTNLEQQSRMKQWLNRQADRSVIYVSFGSMGFPPPDQILELSKALLKLEKPFIFSLPIGQHKNLPEEVTAKTATQFQDGQYLILPWAPQKMILLHPATSVFLSHCGWNSTMESVFCGVPVVAWPLFTDQKMNGQWLAKQGIAVLVEGTGLWPDRIVPAEEIVSVIQQVGGTDNTNPTSFRLAAETWKQKVHGANDVSGSSSVELQAFLDSIK